MWKS